MKSLIKAEDYFEKIRKNGAVLFGAGSKARQAAKLLRERHIDILAVCDNDRDLWGKEIFPGIVIEDFREVSKKYGKFTVLITAAVNNAVSIKAELAEGFECYQFCNPFKVEECLLTDEEIEKNQDLIKRIYDCLEDELSKNIFSLNLNYKLTGNMLPLADLAHGKNSVLTYFDEELFDRKRRHTFIDIGAYTGDSIMSFLMATGGNYEKIIAYEADEGNYASLKKFLDCARVPGIELLHTALWSECKERIFFTFEDNYRVNYDSPNFHTAVDSIADNKILKEAHGKKIASGCRRMYVHTLDSQAKDMAPTVIKVNAMADDFEILKGGKELIKRWKPFLICEFGVRKEDLFTMIPWLKDLNPEYKFYLREKKIFHDIKTILYVK